jgi:hypothetical protein
MSKLSRTLHHIFLPHESNNQRAKLLHPSSLVVIIVLFIGFQSWLGLASSTFPHILGYASVIPPEEVVRLTNEKRASQGLAALSLNSQLSAAAAQKAADMFAKNYWAHVSPSGTQPWFFITESGYSYRFAGENLARDFSDPSAVINAWMDSPTHKENLLNTKYQDIGVAVVDGTLEGRETTLVVQMFGTALSSTAKAAPQIRLPNIAVKAAADEAPEPVVEEPEPTILPVIAQAENVEIAVTNAPMVSPFSITKAVSLGLLAIIILVLVLDLIHVRKNKIVRWTSKSMAHLVFLGFLLIAAAIMYAGRII